MKSNEVDVKLPEFHCLRCGHKWFPRKQEVPLRCSRCKSAFYRWERGERKRS